jgi:hypothetical protein
MDAQPSAPGGSLLPTSSQLLQGGQRGEARPSAPGSSLLPTSSQLLQGGQRSEQKPDAPDEHPAEQPKAAQPEEQPPTTPRLRRRSTMRAQRQGSVQQPPPSISVELQVTDCC